MKNLEKYKEHMKRMKNDPEYAKKEIGKREQKVKEYWMSLKPFKNSFDVPRIPQNDKEWYQNKLIELGAIPKNKMEIGKWYYGDNRNAEFGKWDGKVIKHLNSSFGQFYWDESNHFQDDNGYALFTPLREATPNETESEESKIKG